MKEIGFLDVEWSKQVNRIYNGGILNILIGPSGAGKTTYFTNEGVWRYSEIVSSDQLRAELCGDFRDQSKNKQVFSALHAIVKARIDNGLHAVVDATNIKNADRKALRDLVPDNGSIVYYVIDRDLKTKKCDGGWRNEVVINGLTLVEKHHNIMQSNLKDIISGDNDPRVEVRDLRN